MVSYFSKYNQKKEKKSMEPEVLEKVKKSTESKQFKAIEMVAHKFIDILANLGAPCAIAIHIPLLDARMVVTSKVYSKEALIDHLLACVTDISAGALEKIEPPHVGQVLPIKPDLH
jgi:hypothetical protein